MAGELMALAGCRFDLSAEIPIRAQIYSVGSEQHVVGIVVHHIAFDGWSLAPMVRDVGQAYRARRQGQVPQWAPLAAQYVDYTLWQRELLGAESDPDSVIAGQLRYWRQELADLPEVVSLPADRARPPVPSYRGDEVELRIDPPVWAGVKQVAAAHNATASMVLQAVLAVVLHRVGAGEDVVLGATIAGRLDEALDDLVGFFVNTWVLRVGVNSAHRFSEVLAAGASEGAGCVQQSGGSVRAAGRAAQPGALCGASPAVSGGHGLPEQCAPRGGARRGQRRAAGGVHPHRQVRPGYRAE